MDIIIKATIIILIIMAMFVCWGLYTRSKFTILLTQINEEDSEIDSALIKRFDALAKMLDFPKSDSEHEAKALAGAVNLHKSMDMAERSFANHQMDELSEKLSTLTEKHPELKASKNYRKLQLSISEAEEHLQKSRKLYNMNVLAYNHLLKSWPERIIGLAMHQKAKEFFEEEEEYDEPKRENVSGIKY